MEVIYTPQFRRTLKGMSPAIRRVAEERVIIFRRNPRDPRLKNHKLKGRLKIFWSFSVTHSHRTVFEFIGKDRALFHKIGDHDIYT